MFEKKILGVVMFALPDQVGHGTRSQGSTRSEHTPSRILGPWICSRDRGDVYPMPSFLNGFVFHGI